MRRLCTCLLSVAALSASLLVTGCALETTSTPVAQPGVAIQGQVYGGRQAVTGAHVYLLAATTTGYGGAGIAPSALNASVSLLKVANTGQSDSLGAYVLSDNNGGNFSITGDYVCPGSNPQVYLYALGGNSGAGENPAAAFITALGPCNSLQSSTFVYMDEIVTVASAYALAGFASDATHIGSSATALAKTGITNAFATVGNLVNRSTGQPRATTPNGNGTVPQQELNSLANSIAACVNTNVSTGSTQCSTLFKNATSDGVTCTSAPCTDEPTDTASAAINIAHFPSANVAAIFNLATGIGAPYQTPLSSAPANWTMSVSFTGGGLTPGQGQVEGIAVDGFGNLWIAPVYSDLAQDPGTVLSEFNTLGVPANAGLSNLGLNFPNGVAIDANSTHVWIANYGTDSAVNYTIGGTHTSYSAGGTGVGPLTVSLDGAGFSWVANTTTAPWVVRLNPTSGAIVTTLTSAYVAGSEAVAFEPGALGNVWVANGGEQYAGLFSNAGADVNHVATGQAYGVAIDAGGNAWFSNLGSGVRKVTSTGSSSVYYNFTGATGTAGNSSIVFDGASNLWTASNDYISGKATDNAIFAVSNTGANLTGATGFAPLTSSVQPNSVVVDGSGNVWYNSQTDSVLRELVGAAVPVVTPIAYGVANSMLGTRP